VNKAGELLCDFAAAAELVIGTGRVKGDNGQPSFTGYYKDKRSRPDHVLMSPEVYKLSKRFKMLKNFISDHSGLSMVFRVRSAMGGDERTAHVCRAGQCVNKQVLRWKPERALAYACNIVNNAELMKQFDEAEKDKRVDVLAFCIRSLIMQAASSREVGMSSPARCPLVRERQRRGPLNPVWFDADLSV